MPIQTYPAGTVPQASLADIQARLMQIEQAGSRYNLLLNSEFETFSPSGTEPVNWGAFWSGGTRTQSQDINTFYRGGSSWKVAMGTDNPFIRMQSDEFRVIPGDVLRGTAKWMTSNIAGTGRIYIQTSDIVGQANFFGTNVIQTGMPAAVTASAINVWQTLTADMVVPANHIACRFVLEMNAAPGVASNMWGDSASLQSYGPPNALDDSGWVAPTLGGTWVNYGATWETAGYRRKNGIVHLRGLIKNGAATGVLFSLPSGFRPGSDKIFSVIANTGSLRIDILNGGTVQVNGFSGGGDASYVSLSPISFLAEQ